MEKPSLERSEGQSSTGIATHILAAQLRPCPPLCQRWNATDGDIYCRLCWRDFTHPKPLRIAEGRA
jgi:hypothetical protein